MKNVLKVLTALAAVVGAVYVIATYGDKIVAWAKNLMASCPCCKNECEIVEADFAAEEPAAEPVEEPAAPEATVEIVIEGNEPVAEEADFEA